MPSYVSFSNVETSRSEIILYRLQLWQIEIRLRSQFPLPEKSNTVKEFSPTATRYLRNILNICDSTFAVAKVLWQPVVSRRVAQRVKDTRTEDGVPLKWTADLVERAVSLVDDSPRRVVDCTAGTIVQVATFRDNTISIGPPGKPRWFSTESRCTAAIVPAISTARPNAQVWLVYYRLVLTT